MPHVFISYKHEDLAFAQELTLFAQRMGVPIWLDTNIQPGEEWREAIDKAIAEAFAVVVIMTPEARLSEYITYEWAYAMGLRIPVIPVLLRPTPLHPKLEVLQYIDFTRGWLASLWVKLIERLQAVQGAPPTRQAQQPAMVQSAPPPRTEPPTVEEQLSQSVVNFFTSSPVENPALIFGLAKGIAQQIYDTHDNAKRKTVVESVQTQISQLRRNSNNPQYIQQAANLEIALALVTGLGLLESVVKQGTFVRMGMPAIPKK